MGHYKTANICTTVVPEAKRENKERNRGEESLFKEIMANLGKETDIQIQEAQRVSKKNSNTHMRYIIIKLSKVKDKE